MKHKTIALIFMSLFISFISKSQDKAGINDPNGYFYSLSGDAANPQVSTTLPEATDDPVRSSVVKQLNIARLNNDAEKVIELQNRLNQIDGAASLTYINDPQKTGILETQQQFIQETGDGITTIGGGGYWAIATQTSNRSNKIYAAVTEYVSATADQMKIYVSYNNGVSWVLKGTYNGFVNGVRFYNEELDIEPVINGADTMLFAVGGYVYNGHRYSLIARFNIGTGIVNAQSFSLSSSATLNYNPRVTSDNTVFGSNAYVYVTVSNDTLISANNHKVRQRLCVIQNAFAPAFTQTHKIPYASSGGFYWFVTGAPNGYYLSQDVAYYYNSTDNSDNIYTAVIFSGYNNVYTAWSKNTAGTIAGNLIITDTRLVSKVRLAFNGGSGNTNGAIVYLRNYTTDPNGDVDVRCQNTISGGTTISSFTGSYAEFTSDTALSCDIQAVKTANNKFKFAYSVKGGRCYYLSNTSTSLYTTRFLVNNIPAGLGFGRVRAGYRVTASDSCLSVWSRNDGGSMYCTYGCENFTGIEPSGGIIPQTFSLSQNYPNPFNPVTNIKFSIPNASFVRILVYDISGREVARLLDKQMTAGNFTVDFDASNFASGVYFYRMEADGFSEVKKMMIVK
jgi:hypothetical protein